MRNSSLGNTRFLEIRFQALQTNFIADLGEGLASLVVVISAEVGEAIFVGGPLSAYLGLIVKMALLPVELALLGPTSNHTTNIEAAALVTGGLILHLTLILLMWRRVTIRHI